MELEEATRSTRRDMLKKLAVTGAAAGLTSTVVSSIAFADGGTAASKPIEVSGTVGLVERARSSNSLQVRLSTAFLALGECPFGSPQDPRREFYWEIVGQPTGNTVAMTPGNTTFGAATPQTFTAVSDFSNAVYTVKVTARWVCDQRPTNATTAAWICRAWTFQIFQNFDAITSAITVIIGSATTTSAGTVCDSPLPLPS